MNLPHLKPVRFVNDIISCDGDKAKVSCTFPYLPTLAMMIEASAQSSVAFSKDEVSRIGFLVLVKDVELFREFQELDCIISLKQTFALGDQFEFHFELFDHNEDNVFASGSFMILLQ
jgi:hypothetical protein